LFFLEENTMSDTLAPVVPIRPGLTASYGDTRAIGDIHAVLTGAACLSGDETAACVAEIIARTGRRLEPVREITAEVTWDGPGMPVARVDADGTVVLVSQDPGGPGGLIQVTTRNPAEAAGLVITVDGRPAVHSPARPARPQRNTRRLAPSGPARPSGGPDAGGDPS
jgi:hypothetical protein